MSAKKGSSLILSIGVDDYWDPDIPRLRWATADARAIHALANGGRDPKTVEQRLLIGDDATVQNIRHALGDWLASARPEDNVTVFFAGHGGREVTSRAGREPDSYLLGVDAQRTTLYSTALSLSEELPRILGRIEAEHVTCILDCCLAGSSRGPVSSGVRNRGVDGPRVRQVEAHLGHRLRSAIPLANEGAADIGEGAVVLSACGPHQAALEVDAHEHGLFTASLLAVAQQARDAGSTTMSTGRLYDEALVRVRAASGSEQIPALEGRLSGHRFFVGLPDT